MVKYLQVDIETGPAFNSVDDLEKYLSDARVEAFFERRIEGYIHERAFRRFQSEGDDASGPWAPLSAATLKIKRKTGTFSHGINVRSGQLMTWATEGTFEVSRSSGGASYTYPKKKPSGELAKKVKGAQFGDGSAPARPVIALGDRDAIEILNRFATYFDEVLK